MQDREEGSRISRLILAGNSLAAPVRGEDDKKIVSLSITACVTAHLQKRYNASFKPIYSSHPTKSLQTLLTDLLSSSLPITLSPGPGDPAGATLPQQPLPKVMLGGKSKMEGLESVTNPAWVEVEGRSFLLSGGQTLDDVYKYLPANGRLGMAKRTLEWRHIAPTAPDTLCEL